VDCPKIKSRGKERKKKKKKKINWYSLTYLQNLVYERKEGKKRNVSQKGDSINQRKDKRSVGLVAGKGNVTSNRKVKKKTSS